MIWFWMQQRDWRRPYIRFNTHKRHPISHCHVRGMRCLLWGFGWKLTLDSKVHGANMGPTWGRQDPGGPHVGPMNLAIWGTSLYWHHTLHEDLINSWVYLAGVNATVERPHCLEVLLHPLLELLGNMVCAEEILQIFGFCGVDGAASIHTLDDCGYVTKHQSMHQCWTRNMQKVRESLFVKWKC